jgi:VanZ family protein
VIAYMAMLFFFSSLSTLPPPPADLTDKHVHFAAYAGLAAVTLRALAKGTWKQVTLGAVCGAIAISSLYGVSDEYHQWFVPGRNFERLDMIADTIGSVLGGAAVWTWSILRHDSSGRHK